MFHRVFYASDGHVRSKPIFLNRKVQANFTLESGQIALVAGGPRLEEIDHVWDKVPLLGDLPLVGGLFQSHYQRTYYRRMLFLVEAEFAPKD